MEELIRIQKLKKYFPIRRGIFKRVVGYVRAVDDINLSIPRSKVLGLVGESGCGKTTVGRTILRLWEPTEGEIYFEGQDITRLGPEEVKKLRKKMQIVFQDPSASLNPRMRVGTIINRGMVLNASYSPKERRERTLHLMDKIGLLADHYDRYPHELSGGQQQRVGIARALSVEPEFIVLDEPTSALDVSVQAQILNLLKEIQKGMDLTMLFISHNLSVINHICDRIAVMYAGKIVEAADRDVLFQAPAHPYTQALLSSIPDIGKKKGTGQILLKGELSNLSNPPAGCRFHTRCFLKGPGCDGEEPPLIEVEKDHLAACHYSQKQP
jgi:oligopeptide/dipeptide ABC transporter ATP-binding protein